MEQNSRIEKIAQWNLFAKKKKRKMLGYFCIQIQSSLSLLHRLFEIIDEFQVRVLFLFGRLF